MEQNQNKFSCTLKIVIFLLRPCQVNQHIIPNPALLDMSVTAKDAAIAKVNELERDPKNKDTPASAFVHAREFISYIFDRVEGLEEDEFGVEPLPSGINLMFVGIDKKDKKMWNVISVTVDQSGRILLHDLHNSNKTFDMHDEALLTYLKTFLEYGPKHPLFEMDNIG